MKKKLKLKFGRMCLACSIFLLSMSPAYAHSDESNLADLKDQQNAINQEQQATSEQLAAAQKKVDDAIAVIEELDQKICEVEDAIVQLDRAIEENLKKLEAAKEDLLEAEMEEAYWYEALKHRIQIMYESGDVSYLEVLLKAESVSDLFSKMEYSKALAEKDQEIMANLTVSRMNVERQKAIIEEEERVLEQNRAEEQAQKEELERIKEEKNAELVELEKDADALAIYQEHLNSVEQEIQAEIRATEKAIAARKAAEEAARKAAAEKAAAEAAAKAEAERQEAEKNNASQNNSQTQPDTEKPEVSEPEPEPEPEAPPAAWSGLGWPVSGYSYISSPYGWRTHPISGRSEFHLGIDIPAAGGTPIRAAASGTVVTARYNASYGNYVMISHGDGTATLYAHARALNVSVGQTVSAGQTIAYVGTTGASTGNHLHFEVRKNGSTVDPLAYVSP